MLAMKGGPLFDYAIVVGELLRASKRCLVQVLEACHQARAWTRLAVHLFCIVPHDIQTLHLLHPSGSLRCECATWYADAIRFLQFSFCAAVRSNREL